MNSIIDARGEIEHALDRFEPNAIAGLLAVLAKVCPRCGKLMAVRTSMKTTAGRTVWVRCPTCGKTTKRSL